jgi:hypothetical protein
VEHADEGLKNWTAEGLTEEKTEGLEAEGLKPI